MSDWFRGVRAPSRARGRRSPSCGSELVHLGGRRGYASRSRPEVGVDGNTSTDRDDASQTVAVVGDAVPYDKYLVRWDRIAGCIEGTCWQTPPGRGWGHAPIIPLPVPVCRQRPPKIPPVARTAARVRRRRRDQPGTPKAISSVAGSPLAVPLRREAGR
jgi:hypothetical protein